jgi:hypothetical protein
MALHAKMQAGVASLRLDSIHFFFMNLHSLRVFDIYPFSGGRTRRA